MIIRLLFLLLSFSVKATVFQMQPVVEQIKDADGIIIGHYLRSKTVQLENGKIATQMIFKMNKEIGMQSELFGMDEIIVHYPGGKYGDQNMMVDGVPFFVSGENVVLMIKSHENRYWGMNLGFGTFKVISYGYEKMIINTLFPNDRSVGQMKLEEFEKHVKAIKKKNFKIVNNPHYPTESDKSETERLPASILEGKNRAIASISEEEENNKQDQTELHTVWLVSLLALLGGIFRMLRHREAK